MAKEFKGPLDYIDVATRIVEFREKFPLGSLQKISMEFVQVAGKDWVVYTAAAYRSPDDLLPGVGTAWEPIPGPTPYTRDSEVQNAETAAWGRAMVAALAVDTKQGIASSEEVRNRQAKTPDRDWKAEIAGLKNREDALHLYSEARTRRAPAEILEAITEKGKTFTAPKDADVQSDG